MKGSKGLSLVELLVVVALIAIVATIGTSIMNMYARSKVNKVRDEVVSYLERARMLSMSSMPHGMKCYKESDHYQFKLVALKDGICESTTTKCFKDMECGGSTLCMPGNYMKDSTDEIIDVEGNSVVNIIPSGLSLCCLSSSCGDYTIWFDRKGVPRDASWGLGMVTIRIKDKSNVDLTSISISASGRIQYEQ